MRTDLSNGAAAPRFPRAGALVASAVVLLVLLAVALLGGLRFEDHLLNEEHLAVSNIVSRYQSSLSRALNRQASVLASLETAVNARMGGGGEHILEEHFQTFAAAVHASAPAIDVITVAHGGINRFVYPSEGNEHLIGMDLFDPDAALAFDPRVAIESGHAILFGPCISGQDADRVIACDPIFRDGQFWGLITVAFDLDRLIDETMIRQASQEVDIALACGDGTVFFGNPGVFDGEPVTASIGLVERGISVAAIPRNGGWHSAIEPQIRLYWATVAPFCVLLALVVYLMMGRQATLAVAVRRRTQELSLANQNLQDEIADRKHTEEALRQSEEHLSTTLLSIGEAVVATDADGVVTLLNPVAERLTGWNRKEALGRRVEEVLQVGEESGEPVACQAWQVLESGRPGERMGERLLRARDGATHLIAESCFPIWNALDEIRGSVSVLREVGEELRAQRALAESERTLRTLMSNLPGMVYRCRNDELWTMEFVSEGALELTGYPPEELINNRRLAFVEVIHESDRERVRRVIEEAIGARRPFQINYRLVRRDGEVRWVWEKGQGIRSVAGDLLFLEGFISDITELKKAEEALQRSRDFYLRLFDEFPNPIWRADATGQWNYFNKGWLAFTGRTVEQESGRGWLLGVHPHDRKTFEATFKNALAARRPFVMEFRLAHREGEHRWMANYCRPFFDVDGRFAGYIGCCFDVHDRRRADEALAREAVVNASIAELSSELHILNSAEDISRTILAHTRKLGDCELAVVGHADPANANSACVHIDPIQPAQDPLIDPKAMDYLWGLMLRTHQPLLSNDIHSDDRLNFDGLVAPKIKNLLCMPCLLGEQVVGMIAMANAPQDFNETSLDAAWRISTLFTLAFQRRRAEEEQARTQEHLQQMQKLEAIGQLAGGVAHDFNNLLVGILGYANLMKIESPRGSIVHDAAKTIERAAELTQQLLGYARRGKHQNVQVDLHRLIHEAVSLLERTMEKSIRLTQNLRSKRSVVMGDPNQLQQVLINLAVNARDAMPNGGELAIRSDFTAIDEEFCRTHPWATIGKYIRITVSDTGTGISPEVQDRIFEPFFTTKEQGKGTGLGLAMVYGIVKNHGGYVTVDSTVGHGTTFSIFLPAASASTPQATDTDTILPERGTGHILVVDDEEVVRTVTTQMLKRLGYTVHAAAGGREALAYYEANREKIDTVLLDMLMPELNGQETFRRLKQIDPQVRAILFSGYGLNEKAQEIMDEGMLAFIHKPFNLKELAEALKIAVKEKQ